MAIKKMPDTIEELSENPEAYGMPSLTDFIKNKERWLGRPDDKLAGIDRGDLMLRCKQKYFVEGYRVDSLEQATRIASDMGFSLYEDFIIDSQVKTDESSRLMIEVNFKSKETIKKRSGW